MGESSQVEQQVGLTFDELLATSPVDDAVTLARLLRDELDAGRIDFVPAGGRYALNGGLDDATKQALRELDEL